MREFNYFCENSLKDIAIVISMTRDADAANRGYMQGRCSIGRFAHSHIITHLKA